MTDTTKWGSMVKDKVLELTDDGSLILHGEKGDSIQIKPDDASNFGLITQEILREIDLYEPDRSSVQKLIDRLRSAARAEAKECSPYPGQRMFAPNTVIVSSRKTT